eukprot:2974714-Amphidinium_carterae.1
MSTLGFKPMRVTSVELESTPLDHSGKLSCICLRCLVVSACVSEHSCVGVWAQSPSDKKEVFAFLRPSKGGESCRQRQGGNLAARAHQALGFGAQEEESRETFTATTLGRCSLQRNHGQ